MDRARHLAKSGPSTAAEVMLDKVLRQRHARDVIKTQSPDPAVRVFLPKVKNSIAPYRRLSYDTTLGIIHTREYSKRV